MSRRFQILVALLAVLAVSGAAVSAAAAAQFHSSTSSTTVTAAQTLQHVFTVTSGTVKCTTWTGSGKSSGTTQSSVTLSPTYGGCKAFGLNTPIDVNGCAIVFTNTGATSVSSDIECTGSTKYIAVTAPGCELQIGPQTGLNTITLSNIAGGDISASISVEKISYTEIGASCASPGAHTNGTYTGSSIMDGNDTSSNISYS